MTWRAVPIPTDDRTTWLEARRQGIGASDIAGILGLSPWTSPYKVWVEKTNGYDQDDTDALYWGRAMEQPILDRFTLEEPGLTQIDIGLVHHADYPWAMATPDRLAAEAGYELGDDLRLMALGVIEAKSDGQFGFWEEIPAHYEAQVQWQMFVTGLEHAWIPVLHGGRRFKVYELSANGAVHQRLFTAAEEFYEKHVVAGVPPEVDGSQATARILSDLWTPAGESVELDKRAAADLRQLVAFRKERKRLDEEVRRLENRLKVLLEDADYGTVDGVNVVSWKRSERKGFFVEPSVGRRFVVLKGAGN